MWRSSRYFHYLSGSVLCHSYDSPGQYVSLFRLSASICVTIYLTVISPWPLANWILVCQSWKWISAYLLSSLLCPHLPHGPKNIERNSTKANAPTTYIPKLHKEDSLLQEFLWAPVIHKWTHKFLQSQRLHGALTEIINFPYDMEVEWLNWNDSSSSVVLRASWEQPVTKLLLGHSVEVFSQFPGGPHHHLPAEIKINDLMIQNRKYNEKKKVPKTTKCLLARDVLSCCLHLFVCVERNLLGW